MVFRSMESAFLRQQPEPPPGTPLVIAYAGEAVWLLPEHALWWPAQRVLFIADLHLGKAATYRTLGQPVPAGTGWPSAR